MTLGNDKAVDSSADGQLRIQIQAPVGRDGAILLRFLREQGIEAALCDTLGELTSSLLDNTAAVVITAESLEDSARGRFEKALESQPAWSDIPILLLAGGVPGAGLMSVDIPDANVTVIERPVNPSAFLTAVHAALRARRLQFQVRDLLRDAEAARHEAEVNQAHIEALNERLQRAMTETHHRVKNNLQIIAAMVDMRAMDNSETVPTEEFRQLGSHIRVLATVHDLLTAEAKEDGQAHTVSARNILSRLLPLIQQTAGRCSLKFDLDDARLTVRQGTSLALIVNELVSNGVKYGRDSVQLRFAVCDKCASLQVTDNGRGFPVGFDPVKAANTGLELIQHLSRWDLGGAIEFSNAPEGGGQVTVEFPL
jgi:two-component sensor histidine kinase